MLLVAIGVVTAKLSYVSVCSTMLNENTVILKIVFVACLIVFMGSLIVFLGFLIVFLCSLMTYI